ncbi:MAG: 2Fe-2S iron-sulfur cluster-binding protein [Anaerotruncus sp.]|nr:2Fe-2S iron-sulfur cluster-binding protein [Anaerotruncus sp.]
MYLAIRADGRTVRTVEGLAEGDTLSPVQEAFIEKDGYQCGFCTPGFLMTTTAFLEKNPSPSRDEITSVALRESLPLRQLRQDLPTPSTPRPRSGRGPEMRGKAYTSYARDEAADQARPAKAAPARSVEPRPEAPAPAFRHIGKKTPRVDGREVVTGRAKYTHDVRLLGLLVGKVLRSPHAAAEVVSIDLAPALAVPGVRAALKLAEGKVRYAGQQVAAVAAVDERTAEKALARIKVEYRTLPHVVDWERARDAAAPQVRDGKPNLEDLYDVRPGRRRKGPGRGRYRRRAHLPDRLRGPQHRPRPTAASPPGRATTSSSTTRPRTSTASATVWPGPSRSRRPTSPSSRTTWAAASAASSAWAITRSRRPTWPARRGGR